VETDAPQNVWVIDALLLPYFRKQSRDWLLGHDSRKKYEMRRIKKKLIKGNLFQEDCPETKSVQKQAHEEQLTKRQGPDDAHGRKKRRRKGLRQIEHSHFDQLQTNSRKPS
jgi:hypothetical protein